MSQFFVDMRTTHGENHVFGQEIEINEGIEYLRATLFTDLTNGKWKKISFIAKDTNLGRIALGGSNLSNDGTNGIMMNANDAINTDAISTRAYAVANVDFNTVGTQHLIIVGER